MFDLDDLVIKVAESNEDYEKIYSLRSIGYGKYFADRSKIFDDFDKRSNPIYLLAETRDKRPLGTMRILDQRHGKIELENYLDLKSLVGHTEHPYVEATRFCIIKSENTKMIKIALWKALYFYCRSRKVKTIIIWVRKGATRDYEKLLFESLGEKGTFIHPILGNHVHFTYKFDVDDAERKYQLCNHSLYHTIFMIKQPDMLIE